MTAVLIAAVIAMAAVAHQQSRPSLLQESAAAPRPAHPSSQRPIEPIHLDPPKTTAHRNEASEIAGSLSHGVPAPTTSVARVSQHLNDVSRIEAESHPSARLVQSMLIH